VANQAGVAILRARSVKIAWAIVLSLWATLVVALSLVAGTFTIAPLVLEGQASSMLVPWVFTGTAVGGSAIGALVARLLPSVAKTYSWSWLTLSGVLGWPIAWWIGMETRQTLANTATDGIFAITFNLAHTSWWNAAIAIVAFLVLLARTGTSLNRATASS